MKSVFTLRTGQQIDAELILGYYTHLLRLPQRFFDTMRVGEITSRINDAVKIRAFINDVALELIVDFFVVLFSFGLLTCVQVRGSRCSRPRPSRSTRCSPRPRTGTTVVPHARSWSGRRISRRNWWNRWAPRRRSSDSASRNTRTCAPRGGSCVSCAACMEWG